MAIDEVVVAADDRRGKLPVDELVDCKLSGFEVLDLLSFFEKELQVVKIDLLDPSWIFLTDRGFRISLPARIAKRVLDLATASILLALGSPIMLGVSFASLIESRFRDPIFYHQVRVGQHGKLFRIHKFRSMRVDAEADGGPDGPHTMTRASRPSAISSARRASMSCRSSSTCSRAR